MRYTQIATIAMGKAPAGMVLSREGASLYVANRDSNDVGVIDTRTHKIVNKINVGKHPFGVALSGNGQFVYVVNVESNSVSVIDVKRDVVVATIPVGEHPYCVTTNSLYRPNPLCDEYS